MRVKIATDLKGTDHFELSLIVEGTTENVIKFETPMKQNSIKILPFDDQKVLLNNADRFKHDAILYLV